MDKCPSCGADSLFVRFGPWIDFAGQAHYGGRIEAFCNSIDCDQRFWWHPGSGRVTRRNTGQTYAQYRANRLSTCQRPHAAEVTVTLGEPGSERLTIGRAESHILVFEPRSGWWQTALGWVYWLRGVFRLALPGGQGSGS